MNTSEPFVVDPAKKPFYDLLQKAEAWVDEQGFNHNCDARLAAFALSLLQWKDVADGLPEVEGKYLVQMKQFKGATVADYAERHRDNWLEYVVAYVPMKITEYEKQETTQL